MAALHWIEPPQSPVVLMIHVTGSSNLGRAYGFLPGIPRGIGLVAVPPPGEADDISSMDTWVRRQADELLTMIPIPRLILVGQCIAGHVSMHLADEMHRRQVAVSRLFRLETRSLSYYMNVPITKLLALPGPSHSYGTIADEFSDLKKLYREGGHPVQWWGRRVVEILQENISCLDGALISQGIATTKNVSNVRMLYLGWARFVVLVLTAPEANGFAGTVDVLSNESISDGDEPQPAASWPPVLPVEHDYMLAELAQTSWFWDAVRDLAVID